MNAPFIPFEPEHAPTFTLGRQLAEAKARIGAERWAELSAEWDDPVDLQLVEGGK